MLGAARQRKRLVVHKVVHTIPTIIQLVAFEGQVRTSLVRTLESIFEEADEAGWQRVIALPAVGAWSAWASEMQTTGVEMREAPAEGLEGWIEGLIEEAEGPVVLHTHFTSFDVPAARAAARSDRAAVIWHIHTVLGRSPPMVARHVGKLALGRRLKVDAIVCPSEPMAAALRRRGAPGKKLHVFQSAVDLEAFPTLGPERRAAARKALALPNDAAVLLHFGWDWKLKGGDRLLGTVAALREQGVDARAMTRADHDVQRHIDAAGLSEWVRVQTPSDPLEIFGAADAMMATSRGEGLPFTVLEAMAVGTSVVATDIPGHRLVQDAPLVHHRPGRGRHGLPPRSGPCSTATPRSRRARRPRPGHGSPSTSRSMPTRGGCSASTSPSCRGPDRFSRPR